MPACTRWGQVVSSVTCRTTLDLAGLRRALNKMHGPEIAVRERRGRAPTSTPGSRRTWRALPLPRAGTDPAPNPLLAAHVVARRPAARPVRRCGCRRPADRRARLRLVLPAAEGRPRRDPVPSSCVGCSTLEWTRARATRRAAVRDPGRRVLPPDGALDRRHDGRRRARAIARPARSAAILRAGDRSVAGQVAPPTGLCLWDGRRY